MIQEVTPGGTAVWTWFAADHIGIDEVQQQWFSSVTQYNSAYDVFHLNSVVQDSTGDLLVSFRFLNAIVKISDPGGGTNPGSIIWKLGGSAPTMEPGTQLALSGDPEGGFSGQHYARYFDAGETLVTLHDNGVPRGVMYEIDEQAMTATFVEDPSVNNSPCCGSAAKLATGDRVIS